MNENLRIQLVDRLRERFGSSFDPLQENHYVVAIPDGAPTIRLLVLADRLLAISMFASPGMRLDRCEAAVKHLNRTVDIAPLEFSVEGGAVSLLVMLRIDTEAEPPAGAIGAFVHGVAELESALRSVHREVWDVVNSHDDRLNNGPIIGGLDDLARSLNSPRGNLAADVAQVLNLNEPQDLELEEDREGVWVLRHGQGATLDLPAPPTEVLVQIREIYNDHPWEGPDG